MTGFDDIILGGGASGLSLAYHLTRAGLSKRRILIVERAPKAGNERTWCFWENGDGPFEAAVHSRWQHLWMHGPDSSQKLDIAPYTYKMIRSGDFYALVDDWLERCPNVTRLYGNFERLEELPQGVRVWVDGQVLEGKWVYNSLYKPQMAQGGSSHLLQHFRGWVVETEQDHFDPHSATFMDFRTEQKGETRFVYVLPLSKRRALVEFTLFSSHLLEDLEYDAGLQDYLTRVLGIESYRVLEIEQGVIPMTDAEFPLHPSPHVLNIGTAGGCAKPSTGYTFRRIQRQAQQITSQILKTGDPIYLPSSFDHYRWMDSVMLRVLATGRQGGAEFFSTLFQRNPPLRVLEFLNEESTPAQDLALMLSVNIPLFVATGLEVTSSSLQHTLKHSLKRSLARG
ncbi:MAG: NAD(P)-binding protein [Pseudopedobacter sp.]|nr:NAD(P)-binding protein [Deinococcales bacterium]